MNPVVGLDVAKGESQVQAFLDKSEPFGKSFSMKHTREELHRFIGFLNEIEVMTGQMPMVILESTGHYHSPVIQYLEEHEVLYILLNPIISYQAKRSSLRKVKTDAIDAYQLCVLYYKEAYRTFCRRSTYSMVGLASNLHRQCSVCSGELYIILENDS